MKKNRLYILLFVFVMFFCVNVSSVFAKQDQYGGGGTSATKSSTSNDCFYEGQVIFNNGNQTGTNFNQTVAVGIEYTCNKSGKCSSEYAAGYTDSNNSSKSLSFSNAKDSFGPNKGSKFYSDGKIKCPSYIVVTKNENNFYFHYECVNGQAANGNCLGNGVKLNKTKTPSGDSLQEKVKNITDDGSYYAPSGATTPATEPKTQKEDEKNHENENLIDKIKEWATGRKDSQKTADTGVDESDELECSQVLGDAFADVLAGIFTLTCVIGVVLLIFTLIFDFIKTISSGEDGALLDAFKKAKIRVIATIILLLLPVFVNFIIDFINNNLIIEDGNIKIGNISECNVVKD